MYSIRDAVLRVGCSEPWARKWIRILGLGQKVGWGIVLSSDDIEVLRGRFNGNKEAA